MGLFEELDDMTVKKLHKSEMGDNRILGTVIGKVTNNYSEEMPGRICVQIPNRDKEANVLKWARLSMPYVGKSYGTYFVPEIGDQVLLVFEDGNIEKPFVIGCIPTMNSSFVSRNSDEANQNKRITSKNGNSILFLDSKEGEGEKDKIQIHTSKEQFQIDLDNENHKIAIMDKEKKNQIIINTESGELAVSAEKKMKIKVGDIEINMNGESGKISVKCSKIKITASDNFDVNTQGMYKVNSDNAMISAKSTCKVEGGTTTIIEGQVIKMG